MRLLSDMSCDPKKFWWASQKIKIIIIFKKLIKSGLWNRKTLNDLLELLKRGMFIGNVYWYIWNEVTLQTDSSSVGNFVSFLLLNSSVLTCSLFKCRQRWFIYIVVDSGRVGVVTDEQQVTDVWVIWILPECQTEPGHQNSLSITKWKNRKLFWVSKCCGLPVECLFWQSGRVLRSGYF